MISEMTFPNYFRFFHCKCFEEKIIGESVYEISKNRHASCTPPQNHAIEFVFHQSNCYSNLELWVWFSSKQKPIFNFGQKIIVALGNHPTTTHQ